MKKQFVAKLIVLGMVLAMLPVSAMAAQQRAITWDANGIYTDSATGDVWWFDENGNQIYRPVYDTDYDYVGIGIFQYSDLILLLSYSFKVGFRTAGFLQSFSASRQNSVAAVGGAGDFINVQRLTVNDFCGKQLNSGLSDHRCFGVLQDTDFSDRTIFDGSFDNDMTVIALSFCDIRSGCQRGLS